MIRSSELARLETRERRRQDGLLRLSGRGGIPIMRFSRCCRVSSVSRVTPVSPMILKAVKRQARCQTEARGASADPFIGVRISGRKTESASRSRSPYIRESSPCDMLARNSDLLLLASSAASRAIVFFCRLSRSEKTILLILVLSESISPLASTVTNELKSPSVAAAEI